MDDSEDDTTGPLFSRDRSLFKLARIMSRHSTAPNFRLGAVIARGKKVLGTGFNDPYKTHPRSNTPYQHIHAELSAIINARCDLRGASIYIYRSGKDENPLLSKPCKNCQEMIKRMGIKWIFYSTNGGFKKIAAESIK